MVTIKKLPAFSRSGKISTPVATYYLDEARGRVEAISGERTVWVRHYRNQDPQAVAQEHFESLVRSCLC